MSEARPMTRRALGAMLGAAAASAQVPAGAPKPANESSDVEASMRRNSEALAKVDVPRGTEPAFKFQA